MNIWLMNEYYYPSVGGIETSLYCLSKELSRMGHNVTIIYKENGREQRNKEYARLCAYPDKYKMFNKLLRPLMPCLTYHNVCDYLNKLCIDESPDIIIGRDAIMSVAGMKINGAVDIYIPPTILKFNTGNVNDNRGLKNKIFYLRERLFIRITWNFQRKALREVDHLFLFSNNMKEQVIETRERGNKDIIVSYPGVDEKYEEENIWYKYDKQKIRFLFIGRIVDDKNLFMFIDALCILKKKKLSFEVSIVGDGIIKEQLICYVEQKELNKRVTFLSSTKNPEKYMRIHDFFVLPSKYEALGQVILESQTCGTPVIGFQTIPQKTKTAVQELVKDGITGYLVSSFDAQSLADTLEKSIALHNQQDAYMKMRRETRSSSLINYSWKRFADKVIAIATA